MKRLIKSFILCVLMTCILAPAFSASATVTYSKGKVEIDRGNGWVPLNVGDEVNESDILSTGFKSEARLNYNGSIISLAALTRIEFSELKTIGKKDIVDLNVSMGAVRSKVSRVDRDPPDYRARTSVAVASVRGTDFVVFANGKVVCYEGKVAVIPIALFNEYSNIITDNSESEEEAEEEGESEELEESDELVESETQDDSVAVEEQATESVKEEPKTEKPVERPILAQNDFDVAEIIITANQEVKVSTKGDVSKPVTEAKKQSKKSKDKIKTAGEKQSDSLGGNFDNSEVKKQEKKYGSIEIKVEIVE